MPYRRMRMVVVLWKQILISTVCCKSHRRNSQAREAAFESIPSRERPSISPLLTGGRKASISIQEVMGKEDCVDWAKDQHSQSCPWVLCWHAGRSCKPSGVEASEVASWRRHCVGGTLSHVSPIVFISLAVQMIPITSSYEELSSVQQYLSREVAEG